MDRLLHWDRAFKHFHQFPSFIGLPPIKSLATVFILQSTRRTSERYPGEITVFILDGAYRIHTHSSTSCHNSDEDENLRLDRWFTLHSTLWSYWSIGEFIHGRSNASYFDITVRCAFGENTSSINVEVACMMRVHNWFRIWGWLLTWVKKIVLEAKW